jgi:hypothetical protein
VGDAFVQETFSTIFLTGAGYSGESTNCESVSIFTDPPSFFTAYVNQPERYPVPSNPATDGSSDAEKQTTAGSNAASKTDLRNMQRLLFSLRPRIAGHVEHEPIIANKKSRVKNRERLRAASSGRRPLRT